MNAAIVTARGGSKSIKEKNIYPALGKPFVSYPLQAAIDAQLIDEVFLDTDSPQIADVGRTLNVKIIDRPPELAGDDVNHGDVIKHDVELVDQMHPDLENVVLLLGNTVMLDGELIDEALGILNEHPEYDSTMSVWEAADDHPMRALDIHDGVLRPYGGVEREAHTMRQSYPKAYYYDQGVWAFRKECVQSHDGPNPWWWMGKRSYPIIRNWVTGRDTASLLDVSIAEWWLSGYPGIKDL